MIRQINQAGIDLIKSFESLRLVPYRDPVGIWTIGYGHTKGVTSGMPAIDELEAEYLLQQDLSDAETEVCKYITAPLTDNQYAAIVSLVYNAGPMPLSLHLGSKLNAGEYEDAADQFLLWNHSRGKVLGGLTNRRKAERELFLTA